ncbi:MAG: hypothetical protein QXX79_05965 [Candidatus Bathyarchaeia archaeon]
MSENLTSARCGGGGYLFSRHDGLVCDGCGENFEKPILATVVSGGSSRTYYACPRCLIKVGDAKHTKHERSGEEAKASTVVVRKSRKSDSDEAKCEHFFGYLKKRPKITPIPDECLTCSKIVECLTY